MITKEEERDVPRLRTVRQDFDQQTGPDLARYCFGVITFCTMASNVGEATNGTPSTLAVFVSQ